MLSKRGFKLTQQFFLDSALYNSLCTSRVLDKTNIVLDPMEFMEHVDTDIKQIVM